MKLYRADKRDFNIGDLIVTAGEFTTKNPEGSARIEHIFESVRPENKPTRSNCLYLFEDISVAKKHWSKMTEGKLYEVEIDENLILHRADMRLVDDAFLAEEESEAIKCASNYWEGQETTTSRIEVLVQNATVTNIVSKDQHERGNFLKSWAL